LADGILTAFFFFSGQQLVPYFGSDVLMFLPRILPFSASVRACHQPFPFFSTIRAAFKHSFLSFTVWLLIGCLFVFFFLRRHRVFQKARLSPWCGTVLGSGSFPFSPFFSIALIPLFFHWG